MRTSMRRRVTAAAFISVAAVIAAIGVSQAANATPPDLTDPEALIQSLAPEYELPTGDAVVLDVPAASRRSDSGEPPTVTFSSHEFSAETTIQLDADLMEASPVGDYRVFISDDTSSATYLKPNPAGGQVLFAAANESGLADMKVRLPLARDAQMIAAASGTFLLALGDGATIRLMPAWARDAVGNPLPTSYSLVGSTLTQVVEVSESTAYPVLADPAWTYSVDYSIGARTPSGTQSALTTCFNCYFPVEGAPAVMPNPSDILPLLVRPWAGSPIVWNFECIFAGQSLVSIPGFSDWEMIFAASPNHVDGYGSSISFYVYKKAGQSNWTLNVSGYIVNDDPIGLGRPAYLTGAFFNWANFASNLTL